MSRPSIPKGTRDFLPAEVRKRQYIFDTIRGVFETWGYVPIETPAMELLETLLGKYGEEGDKLLFRILNNGDFLAKADREALAQMDSQRLALSIARRGLRYDLTVPFARYVVMHRHELSLPFKRYQIQPVWRADRPQKGRYQEFYQCDADVAGSDSLMYEAELVQIYDAVFRKLGLKVRIKLNNRKVLAGMAEVAGVADRFTDMTVAIDKLDKVGWEGVRAEMEARGIGAEAQQRLQAMLEARSVEALAEALAPSQTGRLGIEELQSVLAYLDGIELHNALLFDPTLARGLSYYTGCIFEVVVDTDAHPGVRMGSIGGGGRYADLTGIFGLKGVSGVGISFGAERIYDLLEELNLFPEGLARTLQVLGIAFDEATHRFAFRQISALRQAGIAADLYPEPVKLKKQMKYANAIGVPWVLLVGEDEMKTGKPALKNMHTGAQSAHTLSEILDILRADA